MHTSAWLTAALLGPALTAQVQSVAVGNGRLLCCTFATDAGAMRELRVAEIDGDGPARTFWRRRENAEVLARLDRDRLLVASFGSPYALCVIDLGAATMRELAPGAPHEFVAVHGDDVLHRGDGRGDEPDDFLYATPWRTADERRRLCDAHLDRVPIVAGNLAFAVGRGEREVWAISLARAQGRCVWTAPEDSTSLRLALSPSGTRLAIGSVAADGSGRLDVVDAANGTHVAGWSGLPIQVAVESSQSATLEVTWSDDEHVVCSESRGDRIGVRGAFVHVRRSVLSGEITDETTYGPIGLAHRTPWPSPTAVPGHFELRREGRGTQLCRVGRAGSEFDRAGVQGEAQHFLVFDGDRRAAVLLETTAGWRLLLFAVDAAEPRELATERVSDMTLLPAVPR